MKNLLSVLLIVSTLFLSLGFQTCFASRNKEHYYEEYYNKYSTSRDFEEIQNNAEIKNLKRLLKEAEARNEQLKKEQEQKKENKSSFWSKIKSNFSFFFSSYAGQILSVAFLMAAGLISYGAAVAGYECYKDENCRMCGAINDNSFLSHFKNRLKKIDYADTWKQFLDLSKDLLKNIHIVKIEKEND